VPLFIRNAPTGLMKDLGYGRGYQYDHNAPEAFSGQEHLPAELAGRVIYAPGAFGFEREVKKRLDYWARLRRERGEAGADAPEGPPPAGPGPGPGAGEG